MSIKTERYEVKRSEGDNLNIESVLRTDWDGLNEPCPVCGGKEFDHTRYESGHYGIEEDAVVLRTDYWGRKGSMYTECKDCGEVLYKHPAYDLLGLDSLE